MVRYLTCILMLALSFSLAAIDSLPGSGERVALRDAADLAYHAGTDDQHWHGTNRWAVFFDISEWYANYDSVQFTASEALVYFPSSVANDQATVRLLSDNDNHQPGDELSSVTLTGDLSGWQTFVLPLPVTGSGLWMVLDYATAADNRWVSASTGDGEHSWWWDPNYGDDGWFRNFQQNGYNSEFLFGLNGQFVFPENVADVALTSIEAQRPTSGSTRHIIMAFALQNNSDFTINDLTVKGTLQFPSSSNKETEVKTVSSITLTPRQALTATTDTTDTYQLMSPPCQYLLTGTILGESATATTANNTLSLRFDTFADTIEYVLAENFLRRDTDYIADWWTAEQQVLSGDSVYVLNIFPDEADTLLYRTASRWRLNMLELIGTPAAVVQYDQRQIGFAGLDALQDSLQLMLDRSGDHTFFILDRVSAATWDEVSFTVTLEFKNNGTHVLSSYLGDIRMHAVAAQRNVNTPQGEIPGAVMLERLTPEAGLSIDLLSFNSMQSLEIPLNPGALPVVLPTPSHDQLDLVYWFEHEGDRRILQSGVIPLSDIDDIVVSVGEETETPRPPTFTLSPNPFRGGEPLQIMFSRSEAGDVTQVEIFNIRGRRVRTLSPDTTTPVISWDGHDASQRPCASGVYMVRVTTRRGDSATTSVRRCLLLK